VPPFVSLRNMSTGTEPGYLGIAHRRSSPAARARRTCAWPTASAPTALEERKALLEGFDDVRRNIDASGTMNGLDAFASRAFD